MTRPLTDGVERSFLPKQSLVDADFEVDFIDVVEVREIGIDLEDPVWLRQGEGDDEDETRLAAQERLHLYPGHDIVQSPRDDEEDGRNRDVPAVYRGATEDKGAMEGTEDELRCRQAD